MKGFDLSLGLEGQHVLVTGGAGMIGSTVVDAFLAAGSNVSVFDVMPVTAEKERMFCQTVDITDEHGLVTAFDQARARFGDIGVCIAVAGKDLSFIEHHATMATMSVEQFRQTNRVNLEGTFLTAREWLRGIQSARNPDTLQNMSLVVFGSEAGLMGVKSNADYASSKAALQGLVLSLAPDAASIHPRARVNLIAPGPVDTPQFRKEIAEDPLEGWTEVATVAQGRPTPMSAVAYSCLFLASERYSSSVTGQFHRLDGGKSGKLFHLPARGSIR